MKLKHSILILALLGFGFTAAYAQNKVGYVDSEYILKNVPEYASAQKQIEAQSDKWQKDVDARYAEIEKMYQAYQSQQASLSEGVRKQREDAIVQKERETKDYQRKVFGFEGDLFKERQRLLEPIQQKVSAAVEAVAKSQSIDVMLDKSGQASFLYANPQLDKSRDVLTQMGYKAQN